MSYHIGFAVSTKNSQGEVVAMSYGEPHIKCDTCGKQLFFRKKNGAAPVWFMDGKAPPKWKKGEAINPSTGTTVRRDYCPQCRKSV